MTQIALYNPYCEKLNFEKLDKLHFLLGLSKKKASGLFNIQSDDKNFSFFVSSWAFTFAYEQYQKTSRI